MEKPWQHLFPGQIDNTIVLFVSQSKEKLLNKKFIIINLILIENRLDKKTVVFQVLDLDLENEKILFCQLFLCLV